MLAFNDKQKEQIKEINKSTTMLYLAAAGGGQSFFHHFMAVSGSSGTILGGNIPYSKAQLIKFCNKSIDKFCCADTALLMATKSYQEIVVPMITGLLGIGITSSLTYDNERANRQHKSYIAIHTHEFSLICEINFNDGTTRDEQEFMICEVLLELIHVIAIYNILDINIHHSKGSVDVKYVTRSSFLELKDIPSTENLIALYPGSFNPYHDGHYQMASIAENQLKINVIHEITTRNADKGFINYIDLKNRVDSIHKINPNASVVISDESTFVGKINIVKQLDRSIVVVLGSDTWNRISNPKYGYDTTELLHWFKTNNATFMVFNRTTNPQSTDDNPLQELLLHCDEASQFDNPISSTNIRILNQGN